MLEQLVSHLPDSTSYTQNTYFAGYIDPGLGYSFQSLGPILPAIAGVIAGGVTLFWGKIKLFFYKFTKKETAIAEDEDTIN